jgi:probable rRNA maturation factor
LFETEKTSVISLLKNNKLIPVSFASLPFDELKNKILGKNYSLSVVIVGKKRSALLNSKYRSKNYATDILSFPISKNEGEIFINLNVAKNKSKDFEDGFEKYLLFLVIHGCLHLKGFDHGSKMEKYERTYYSRYRCRYI